MTLWNPLVESLSPFIWLKLDDAATGTVAADSSGNSRDGAYPNGASASYPVRLSTPLTNGSNNGIVCGGGGNTELTITTGTLFDDSTSWTFGMVMKTTSAANQTNLIRITASFYIAFNFDIVPYANSAGTISLTFDAGGAQANALSAVNCGWNDGYRHLILFERNIVADTLSIWKDGVRIATRARAGTAASTGTVTADLLHAHSFNGMGVDEVLCFNKLLTEEQHVDLARGFRLRGGSTAAVSY